MKIKLTDPLFKQAIPLLNLIESHGYEAYFVGGCVRDILLGKKIGDIDIATSAFPQEVQEIFPKHFDVGLEHGTVVVLFEDQTYEVTTFRTESTYSDYRRPDQVDFVRSLEEDTLRRDFTVNAMAVDGRGQVYDFHGGLEDLHSGVLRAVGVPHQRFEEDALRMMRGLRFSSQLGFAIERNTLEAICLLAENLRYISIERTRIELEKMMMGLHLDQALPLFRQTQLASYFPSGDHLYYVQGLQYIVDQTPKIEKVAPLVWTLLFQGMGLEDERDRRSLMKAWTLSNQMIAQVEELISLSQVIQETEIGPLDLYGYSAMSIKLQVALLQNLGRDELAQRLSKSYASLPIYDRSDLKINGKIIIDYLKLSKGGPIIGQLLDQLEKEVLLGQVANESQALLDSLKLLTAKED